MVANDGKVKIVMFNVNEFWYWMMQVKDDLYGKKLHYFS